MKSFTFYKGAMAFVLIAALSATKSSAQCRINEIPAVYTQNFGLGARPAVTPFTNGESPDLTFQPAPLFMDPEKTYTVGPTSDVHSNPAAWHHVPDHTVNNASLPEAQQGRMMIINDREPAGTVFTKSFGSVVFGQGNTHSMSYWVMNLLTPATCHNPGNDPDIYMSVKVEYKVGATWFTLGTSPILQIASTPAPVWIKQTFNFTTPAFVFDSIRTSINNNNVILCGNDFAIDDIEIFHCVSNITLPLDLLNFKGSRIATGINLEWITANEVNVASFSVERSSNGVSFASIRSVNALGMSGNTYAIVDANPLSGRNYYRLKMMDKDGQYKYSQVVSLNWNVKDSKVLVFPNPTVDNRVGIELPQEWKSGAEVTLINSNGQQVLRKTYSNTSVINVPLDGVSKGFYMIQIKQINGDGISVQKLSINK